MAFTIGAAILGAEIAGTVIVGTLTVGAAVGTAVIVGVSVGLQYALRASENKDLPDPEDGSQALRQEIAPRNGVYGRCRPTLYYILYEVKGPISADVLAIAEGLICGVKTIYFTDDAIELGAYSLGYLVTGTIDSALDDGRYADAGIRVDYRLGVTPETAYTKITGSSLFSSVWTTAHRGDGIASLMLWSPSVKQEDFQKRYPHGLPQPSVLVDGYALWDPRDTDQDPDDADTWTDYPAYNAGTTYTAGTRVLYGGVVYYSAAASNVGHTPDENLQWWINVFQNPVLQLIDFLTHVDHGMGLDREALIVPVVDALMVQANLCDVLIEGEPRYRASGFYTFETNPEQVLGAILAACDGWMVEDYDGTLALQVGVYSAPTKTITSKHILGFAIDYGVADEDQVNELAISFLSPDHKYTEQAGEAWRDEDAISSAGRVRSRNLSLTWVPSHSQARRLAKRAMLRLNTTVRGSFETDLYGLYLLGERYLTLQYPLLAAVADVVVEINSARVDLKSGRVRFEWFQVNPALIDVWDVAEEGEPPIIPDVVVREELPIPDNLSGSVASNADSTLRFDIAWDDPQRDDLTYVVRYRTTDGISATGEWIEVKVTDPTIAAGRVSTTIAPVVQGAFFEIQVASVGALGTRSEFSESLLLAAVLPSLDFHLPQNSGYIALIFEDI